MTNELGRSYMPYMYKIHMCTVFCIIRNLYNCVTIMTNFEREGSPGLKHARPMLAVKSAVQFQMSLVI